MQSISELINKVIKDENLIYAIFSGVRKKGEKTFNKVTIKKVIIKMAFFKIFIMIFNMVPYLVICIVYRFNIKKYMSEEARVEI